MFRLPMFFSDAGPVFVGKQVLTPVRKSASGRTEPAAGKPIRAQVAGGATPAGHRRWTVVIPRRLSERAAQAELQAEAFHAAQPAPPAPIRFGPQATMFGMIAAVASGLYVYSTKHAAATLDRQIAHAFEMTGTAHQQTGQLRAEWALLNNPDRLHPLIERYLDLQPLAASQYVRLAELHQHLPAILYGPPQPEPEDDAAPPAARRMLAMASIAAAPEPERPAGPPVVAAPPDAIRVLAHAGVQPDLIGAGDTTAPAAEPDGPGLVETDPAEIAAPRIAASRIAASRIAASRPAVSVAATPRLAAARIAAPATDLLSGELPAHTDLLRGEPPARLDLLRGEPQARLGRATAAAMPAWHPFRPAVPAAMDASRLLAHAEPRPHPPRPTAMLRPELVHELMLPHLLSPGWQPRPRVSFALATPQRRPSIARSEPPHDLMLPSSPARSHFQQQASAEPQIDDESHARIWDAAPNYVAPPRFPNRAPYWAYNSNPYGGRAMPPSMSMYPRYQ